MGGAPGAGAPGEWRRASGAGRGGHGPPGAMGEARLARPGFGITGIGVTRARGGDPRWGTGARPASRAVPTTFQQGGPVLVSYTTSYGGPTGRRNGSSDVPTGDG